jgi:GDP-4-dehydro-6-deoxy-D-mannose reductase
MTVIFLTGAAGFVGGHLATFLSSEGHAVYGTDREEVSPNDKWRGFLTTELTDLDHLRRYLHDLRPDYIFHLAGVLKADQPQEFYQSNLLGTIALFEAVTSAKIKPFVMVASSSAVYGRGFANRPISEGFKIRPASHYAASKATQEIAALRYHRVNRLPVVIMRTFNLLGPGLSPDLACSSFARQIAHAEAGDLRTKRDFLDVRDAVRAYWLLALRGVPGQCYNVCSGKATLMKYCLDTLVSLSHQQLSLTKDANRLQQNDVSIQTGNCTRLRRLTSWRPLIPVRQSLEDLLEFWRERVRLNLET